VQDILDFWFGAAGSADYGTQRRVWFRKDAAFDALVRERFAGRVDAALAGQFDAWRTTSKGCLALVLLLDQFTRNIHRETPRAFSGDAKALTLADHAVGNGFDTRLTALQRWFLYMPFQHSETLADQERSVDLFRRLRIDAPGETALAEAFEYALRHYEVIARFGRFPHRNAVLGRDSTAEERAFLARPGARF
jgi:uncharacterized protein (DUF924 family)